MSATVDSKGFASERGLGRVRRRRPRAGRAYVRSGRATAELEPDLLAICDVCLQPIADGDGHIWVDTDVRGKLSELLGGQAQHDSGLGAPAEIDQLQRRITELEQQVVDLSDQLEERGQELDAARAVNRELIANLNRRV